MVRSICFTGHRHIVRAELPALMKELRRVLETAIPQGFVDFTPAVHWGGIPIVHRRCWICGRSIPVLPCIWCCPVPRGADGTLDRGTKGSL